MWKLNNAVLKLSGAAIRSMNLDMDKAMGAASNEGVNIYLRAIKQELVWAGRADIAQKFYATKAKKVQGRWKAELYSTHPFAKLRDQGSGYLEGGVVKAGKNPPSCGGGGPVTKFLAVPLEPAKRKSGTARKPCSFKFLVPLFKGPKGAEKEKGILAKLHKNGGFTAYYALVKQVKIPPHPYVKPAVDRVAPEVVDTYRYMTLRALKGKVTGGL